MTVLMRVSVDRVMCKYCGTTAVAAVALTPSEKRAVRAIAALRGTDESNLIRTTPVSEIVAEFERRGGIHPVPAEPAA